MSKFPWFPLVTSIATGLGLFGLVYYGSLSSEEKIRFDRMALEHAQRLYGRTLSELTACQRDHINAMVKAEFAS